MIIHIGRFMVFVLALFVAGCWMGASQLAGMGDGDADDDDDGTASDADSDADSDSGADPWSGHQPGELLSAISVKASGFYDTLWGMAAMPGGGVVILGEFGGTAKFDPGGPNETTLSADDGRLFMARYDEDLALVWVRHVFQSGQPSEHGHARSVAVHPDGGFVVAGRFLADATFGAGQSNETHFDAIAGNKDLRLFVARFDDTGALLWVRVAVPGSDVTVPQVAAAPDGRVLIATTFAGSLAFEGEPGMGVITGPECSIVSNDMIPEGLVGNLAVATLSGQGNGLWLRGEGLDVCTLHGGGVWADGNGEVAVAVKSRVPFFVQLAGQQVEIQPGVAILRFTEQGELTRATRLTPEHPTAVLGTGSLVVGSLSGVAGISARASGFSVFLGGGEVYSSPEGSSGYAVALGADQTPTSVGLVKASYSIWVPHWEQTPGFVHHSILDTAVTADGSLLVSGDFEVDISFASADLATQIDLISGEDEKEIGNRYMYVSRFTQGVPNWAVQAGGGVTCFARAVVESESGAVFAGGSFGKHAVFGAGEPGETELSTSGGWDIFLAKFVP